MLSADEAKALAGQLGYDAAGIARPHSASLPARLRSVIVGMHATLDEAFDYEMFIEYDGRRKWYKPIYTALETLSFRLAEALRAAQAETRASYPNPYYWAAFVLTGDPGSAEVRSSAAPANGRTIIYGGAVLASLLLGSAVAWTRRR